MTEEKKEKRKVSEDKKKYVCDICGKKCANPQALKTHKKWKHSGDNKKESDDKSFREREKGRDSGREGKEGNEYGESGWGTIL